MHATVEQLLSFRDGSPLAPALEQHIIECSLCRAALEDLLSWWFTPVGVPTANAAHELLRVKVAAANQVDFLILGLVIGSNHHFRQ